ncbi:MAG: hypothetical protein RLZZ86_2543, partial [Cyanobacteriota bacterium]
DGKLSIIAARELVSGDVMQLEEGDKISADARIKIPDFFDLIILYQNQLY